MPKRKIIHIAGLVLLALCLAAPSLAGGKQDIVAGNRAAQAGKLKQAIRYYTKAIKSGDLDKRNLAVAYNNRGGAKDDLGKSKQALADFAQAIKLDPNFAEAYYSRSYAHEKLGQLKKAVDDILKAVALAPNDRAYLQREYYLKAKLGAKQ